MAYQIGDRVHVRHFADVYPGTVVGFERGNRTMLVRRDSTRPAPNRQQYSQYWIIRENPYGIVDKYTLRKNGVYVLKGAEGYGIVGPDWRHYYSYEF